MGLITAMDRFVRHTGLYGFTMIERPEPRSLRWTPAVLLAALASGYVLLCVADPSPQGLIVGMLLFFAAYLCAFYLRFYGPRIVDDPRHPLDERERDLRARAGRLAGSLLVGIVMLFCLYMGAASLVGGWQPHRPGDWTLLALALQAAHMTLPVLFASWLQPRLDPED